MWRSLERKKNSVLLEINSKNKTSSYRCGWKVNLKKEKPQNFKCNIFRYHIKIFKSIPQLKNVFLDLIWTSRLLCVKKIKSKIWTHAQQKRSVKCPSASQPTLAHTNTLVTQITHIWKGVCMKLSNTGSNSSVGWAFPRSAPLLQQYLLGTKWDFLLVLVKKKNPSFSLEQQDQVQSRPSVDRSEKTGLFLFPPRF